MKARPLIPYCPFRGANVLEQCVGIDCAIWDENWNECGILSISEALERLVDVMIDKK